MNIILGSRNLKAIGFTFCFYDSAVLHPFWNDVLLGLSHEMRSITIVFIGRKVLPTYRQLLDNFTANQTLINIEYVWDYTQMKERMIEINKYYIV